MITGVFGVLLAALGCNPALFDQVASDPSSVLGSALGVAIIGSVSTWLGQITVIALNRIGGWKLVTTWLFNALNLLTWHVVQAGLIWAWASLVTQRQIGLMPLVVVSLLAFAPLSFNVLTVIPHLGLWLARALNIWGYVIMFVGVSGVMDIPLWRGLVLTTIGYIGMQLLAKVLQKPIGAFSSWLWTAMTGEKTMITAKDVLAGVPIMPVVERAEVTA